MGNAAWSMMLPALAACGRFGFATVDDVALGDASAVSDVAVDTSSACVAHDEDGDGILDCDDTCPGHADPLQTDSDGDGVGDACDPGSAAQRLIAFIPFTGPSPFTVTGTGTWAQLGDALQFAAGGTFDLRMPIAMRDIDIWVGASIPAGAGNGSQLAIVLEASSLPHYYTELYEDTQPYVAVARYDGGFSNLATQILPSFPTGAIALHLGARTSSSQMVAELRGSSIDTAIGAVPGYDGAPMLTLWIGQIAVDLEFVAIYETL